MYTQVNKANLSQQIAKTLESMILRQELAIGERLPGEMDLADQFGVSRNVVREALTMLRERGLVQVRNGSGVFVTAVRPEKLGDVFTRMTAIGSVSPYEVYEIRMALEVRACGLAAENGSQQEKAELDGIVGSMEREYYDLDKWYAYDSMFHKSLAQMTHNPLYPALIEPLTRFIFAQDDPSFVPPSIRAILGGIEQHKRICEAVRAGDRAGAEHAMTQHLQTYLDDITYHN